MDKKLGHNVIVGIVVLIGFLGLVFVLFNISGGGLLRSQYTLYGRFAHVKGLHMGSEVSLSGLRIGVVRDIEVAQDGSKDLIAEMAITKKFQERVRADSVASIRTQGVLGDKYIEVSIGSPDEKVIEAGAFINTQEPTDLFTKSGTLVEDISKQFTKGGDFESLMQHLNIIAKNVAAMTTEMRRNKGLMHELISGTSGEKINRAASHLESTMRKIDSGEGSLGALINDPTVYEDVKSMLGGAKRSTILQYFMRQFIESGRQEKEVTKKSK